MNIGALISKTAEKAQYIFDKKAAKTCGKTLLKDVDNSALKPLKKDLVTLSNKNPQHSLNIINNLKTDFEQKFGSELNINGLLRFRKKGNLSIDELKEFTKTLDEGFSELKELGFDLPKKVHIDLPLTSRLEKNLGGVHVMGRDSIYLNPELMTHDKRVVLDTIYHEYGHYMHEKTSPSLYKKLSTHMAFKSFLPKPILKKLSPLTKEDSEFLYKCYLEPNPIELVPITFSDLIRVKGDWSKLCYGTEEDYTKLKEIYNKLGGPQVIKK